MTRTRLVLLITALATVGSPRAATAQQTSGILGTHEGDTITVVVQRVPVRRKAAYERWMTQVWWPAAQKAGQNVAAYGKTLSERRRFVPAEPAERGVLTYMFIYPASPNSALPATKHKGVGAALEASGMPAAQVNRELRKFQALGVTVNIYRLVQHEYQ
jgi:hypothetical protein